MDCADRRAVRRIVLLLIAASCVSAFAEPAAHTRYLRWGESVAAGAVVLVAVLAIWNRMLQQRILQRTADLRESEERFRQIAENIREVFWLASINPMRMLYVSPAYEEVYGRSRQSLYDDPLSLLEAIHPDDRAGFAEAIERHRESHLDLEYRVVRSDGSRRWIRDRAFPIRDEAGVIYRRAGIAEDVTEQELASDALKLAEDRVRLILDTIPAMVWSIRPDGVLEYVNERWLDYTGVSLREAIDAPLGAMHPDDVARSIEKWVADQVSKQPSEDEIRLRRADGQYRWFLIRTVPLIDDRGNVVKWYGTSTDIEDRKRAEQKLAQSDLQLVEAQRVAHVGSWDWDLVEKVGTWSDEYCRLFDLPCDDSFQEEALKLIHPDDRGALLGMVDRAIHHGERYDIFYRIVRRDGSLRIVHSLANVVRDEHGVPLRLFGATQDVTELKKAEADLKTTTEQLRALSADLRSMREEESTRIAREIHDELGANLTSLRWEVEGIRKKISETGRVLPDPELTGMATNMLTLIDTVINAVRRIASDLRPVVLDVLGVEDAIEWQAHQFEERTGIAVHCQSFGNGAELTSEQATTLFRIFQEALTNTLRHSQATRVDVMMKEEEGTFVLTVRDNGRGITEEEKSRQSSIGLLGMRERAGLIGAEVDVAGIEGQGTTVTVRLPMAE